MRESSNPELNIAFSLQAFVTLRYFLIYRMGTEQFCLRWNDFHSNITAAFSEIRDEDDFFDVTLVGVFLQKC
jgi:hypothetical protein